MAKVGTNSHLHLQLANCADISTGLGALHDHPKQSPSVHALLTTLPEQTKLGPVAADLRCLSSTTHSYAHSLPRPPRPERESLFTAYCLATLQSYTLALPYPATSSSNISACQSSHAVALVKDAIFCRHRPEQVTT